jgi:hypothetical protein
MSRRDWSNLGGMGPDSSFADTAIAETAFPQITVGTPAPKRKPLPYVLIAIGRLTLEIKVRFQA